jgi:transcriptional regulator with XRE-family HTH domain
MINPKVTGAYITLLRKERDWTQLELAEKLHVTHQAVSRWETGESFPDLGTLAQLAQVFAVRMDTLLDGGQIPYSDPGRGNVLVEISQGNAEQVAHLVKETPADLQAVIDAAPLTRPSMMNKIVDNMAGYKFSLEQAGALAPFISPAVLYSILDSLSEPMNADALANLAPFLVHGDANRLLEDLPPGSLIITHLINLAPFLDTGSLTHLLDKVSLDSIDNYHLVALAPFLNRGELDTLMERVPINTLDIAQITSLAPFVSTSKLAEMLDGIEITQVKSEHLSLLAPFLDKRKLQQIVEQLPKETLDAQMIVSLAPFLDRQILDSLLHKE